MSLRLLEPAQQELDEAIAWYSAQAPGLGDAFLLETLKAFRLIEQYPFRMAPTERKHTSLSPKPVSLRRDLHFR